MLHCDLFCLIVKSQVHICAVSFMMYNYFYSLQEKYNYRVQCVGFQVYCDCLGKLYCMPIKMWGTLKKIVRGCAKTLWNLTFAISLPKCLILWRIFLTLYGALAYVYKAILSSKQSSNHKVTLNWPDLEKTNVKKNVQNRKIIQCWKEPTCLSMLNVNLNLFYLVLQEKTGELGSFSP